MNSVQPKVGQSELEVEEKKPYQPPRILASYDKEQLEAAMKPMEAAGGCTGCGG